MAEREGADPLGVADRHLVDRQRRQHQRRDDGDPEPGEALAQAAAAEQQHRLGEDREEGEVVGGERQPRGDPPEGEVPATPIAPGADAEEQGGRGEEGEQRVGPRLLGVPEQHRVDGDQRRRHQAGAAAAQLDPDEVRDRDGCHPGQRRERAQPELAGSRHLGPEPGQRVIERRRRLAVADRVHRVAEAAGQDADGGDDLVVVVALDAERGEAQQRRDRRQPGDDPEGPRARPHRLGDGLRERRRAAPAEGPRLHA